MFRDKMIFGTVLLGLAYGLYVFLFGDPFAQKCSVTVEAMKPTSAQLVDRWIDLTAEGNTVVLYDYSQDPENSYTTVRATASYKKGLLKVRSRHDTAADEMQATGNCVVLTITLPEGVTIDDLQEVEVCSTENGGNRMTVIHPLG